MLSLSVLRLCEPLEIPCRRRSSSGGGGGGGAHSSGGGGATLSTPPLLPGLRGAETRRKLRGGGVPVARANVATTTTIAIPDEQDSVATAAPQAEPHHHHNPHHHHHHAPPPPLPGFLFGDRHSHYNPASASAQPFGLYGNYVLTGPARAVKMADGALLVTVEPGGSVALPSADGVSAAGSAADAGDACCFLSSPSEGEDGDGQMSPQPSAAPLRVVLHGELMQLSGAYGLRDAEEEEVEEQEEEEPWSLPAWPAPARSTASAAVRRHCGGAEMHTEPINVLKVSKLAVGAAVVLGAGAELSHPLNATPPGSSSSSSSSSSDEDEQPHEEAAAAAAAAAAVAAAITAAFGGAP